MLSSTPTARSPLLFLGRLWWFPPVAGGATLALLIAKLSTLEFRYALAIYGLIGLISLGMFGLRHLEPLLLYGFVLGIPFALLGKWLFTIPTESVIIPGIMIGAPECFWCSPW